MLSAETHWGNHKASGEESSGRSLYNYFRTYDPAIGRYLEADPSGQAALLNLYGYADSTPITKVDPLGLQAVAPLQPLPTPPLRLVPPAPPTDGATIAETILGALASPFGALAAGVGVALYPSEISDPPVPNQAEGSNSCGGGGKDPCKGLRDQLNNHKQKLADYTQDPIANDNQGLLTREPFFRHLYIIDGRIQSLLNQIDDFEKQLEDCERRNGIRD